MAQKSLSKISLWCFIITCHKLNAVKFLVRVQKYGPDMNTLMGLSAGVMSTANFSYFKYLQNSNKLKLFENKTSRLTC